MPLYAFNYKGRPGETQIGLNADEVEQVKPEAVGLAGGYKTVDYDAATRPRGGLDPASSMGGAVVDLDPHEYRENFAAGGAPDFASSLAQLYAQFGSPQGAQPGGGLAGPYGGRASYVPQANLPVGQLRTADTRGIIRSPTSMAQDVMGTATGIRDFGKTASDLFGMGEKGLGAVRSATRQGPSTAAPPPPTAAAPPAAYLPEVQYDPENRMRQARGGLVGYADGGDVEDPMKSYGAPQGGLDIPTEQPDIKPLNTPTGMPGAPKSVMSDIMDVGKFAASLFAMSDERMKDGMQRVGQLDNGLPVYKYSIGDGPTQIGLSAQEAGGLHPGAAMADDRGILHLDYDRATRAYGGGLDPRAGYAEGGGPSFEDALKRTLQFEGGYTVDTGGPTMMGISSRANPDVDLDRVSRDPQYKAGIYRERYWNPIGADAMDSRMAPVAFDTAVNLGVGGARRLLEQAGGDPGKLLDLRQQHYDNLIARNPEKYGAYERGWRARNDALRQGLGGADGDVAATGARNAQGSGTPPGARQRGFIENLLPSKVDPRTGEETTDWKKILIPALTGLGAMASSPSLYAGSAVLQGLGAGAQAYSNLEKREADIAQTQAGTAQMAAGAESTRFATASNNVFTRDGVTFVQFRDRNTGEIRTLRAHEYWSMDPKDRPTLGGDDMRRLEQARTTSANAPANTPAGTPARTTEPAAPGAAGTTGTPAAPAAPGAPAAPKTPDESGYDPAPMALTPQAIEAARAEKAELDRMEIGADRNSAIAQNAKIASEARKTRDDTLAVTNKLNDLAKPLASLAAGQQITPGAFGKIQATIVDFIDSALVKANMAGQGGGADYRIAPQGLQDYQLAEKAARILTEAKSANLDQRAVRALEVLSQGLANPSQTRETAAEIIAGSYIDKQMALDEAKFTDLYSRSAGAGMTVAKGASQTFRNQQGFRPEDYLRDKAALKDFLQQSIKGKPLLSYLLQQNKDDPLQKRITPKVINEKYGTDIARYFLSR
jgi:hypothetical protein